jgi:hypothetical protein
MVVEGLVLAFLLRTLLVGSRVLPLLLASWVGVTGHVFWDLADGSDINLLRPFAESVFGWHLVAMGEPIVIALLGSAALVAWRWPAHAQRTATAVLIFVGVFLAVKKTTQDWACARYAVAVGAETPQAFAIAPAFGSLFVWTIYDRVDDRVRAWRVDGRSGTVARAFEYRDAADVKAIAVARELPVVRTFLALSRIPFVRTELDGTSRLVFWSDITSCSIRGCAVSFGGAFDGNSTALYQLIRIGAFSQRRALPLGRQ